jgi:O-antigen/teichoic acid export membrane protein
MLEKLHMGPNSQKKIVGRGAAYIYIENISSLISGYIFWLVVSKITSPEIIGTSSTVVTYATIVAVIAGMGVPIGMQRFVGKSFSEKNFDDVKRYVITSLLLIFIGIFACVAMILSTNYWIQNFFGFDFTLIIIAILLVGSFNTTMLFRSTVVASLKTESLPPIFIISSVAKLILAIVLIVTGFGSVGLTLGYTFNHILSSVLLSILLVRTILKPFKTTGLLENFIGNSKKILLGSTVSWIPLLIITVGSQLGTIVVFGSQGANQAGVYFLGLTIVTGITNIMNSLFAIALPTLSGLTDSRKRIAWQTIRLSTIIILPFSSSLLFYSPEIMGLFGPSYVDSSVLLGILLLSMFPMCIISGINTLVYSYGKYRYVLIIGLALSVPQTVLYLALVPVYAGTGAAVGYTIGSVLGCFASIIVARRIGLMLFWKDLVVIFAVPISLGYTLSSLHLNYILGILVTILLSYILLMKMRIVTGTDIQDFLEILPERVSHSITNLIEKYKK